MNINEILETLVNESTDIGSINDDYYELAVNEAKQQLYEALKAKMPKKKQYILNGTSIKYSQLKEYEKVGYNQALDDVEKALDKLFGMNK